jgi:DNA primase
MPITDHFILPVRDPDNGKLWGWQEKGKRYFRNVPEGVRKGHTLFGIREFPADSPAVLVESPLDVARLYTVGYRNAVSSFGAGVTDVHR